MKTCCEHNAPAHGCNSWRLCPVRATRNAGVCTPESDDAQAKDDVVAYVVLMVAVYTVICGWLGYLFGTHGAAIELFLWALAGRIF